VTSIARRLQGLYVDIFGMNGQALKFDTDVDWRFPYHFIRAFTIWV
jgi:hypothetical protein